MISFTNITPDITAAQIAGAVPVIAEMLHSFGVYTLTAAQEGSLTKAIWFAIGLVGADAAIRIGRNVGNAPAKAAAAHVEAMAKTAGGAPSAPASEPTTAAPPVDPAEEAANQPPAAATMGAVPVA